MSLMLLSPLAVLTMQAAPFELPIQPLPIPRRERAEQNAQPTENAASRRLATCLATIASGDSAEGLGQARAWVAQEPGLAEAQHCLGVALSESGDYPAARRAFEAARSAAEPTNAAALARYGALAGNSALAAGDTDAALALLSGAEADALAAQRPDLAAEIAIDRAVALLSAGREAEAASALQYARETNAEDGQAWLLSATLSRRMNDLERAQIQIERAAALLPRDPATALEAGTIAILSGREDAARKSWQSAIDLAPQSAEAETARTYIAQIAPAAAEVQVPPPASLQDTP